MKAVIMAGGMGTRLRPITGEAPKPLAPLLGRPMMEHILRLLKKEGFDEVCAAVRYRAGDIMARFGDGSSLGIKLQYRIEEEPLGTAGAVKNCGDFYGAEDFLVISADAACDFRLSGLIEAHRRSGAAVTLALYRHPEPLSYGLCLRDREGYIRSFVEKPDWSRVVTDLVNTGIYVISPRVMELVPGGREFDFAKDLFPLLLEKGEKLLGVEMEGYWCDVGTPLSYYRCCTDALEGRLKIELPEEFRPKAEAEAEEAQEGGTVLDQPCRSRAELMGILSELLMDMGADYSRGIALRGRGYILRVSPLPRAPALRIRVSCADTEFAKELAASLGELCRALEL